MARNRQQATDFKVPLDFARKVEAAANESWRSGEMLSRVTPTTRELLTTWFSDDWKESRPDLNFHLGQRQAILNAIYLHEVVAAKDIREAYEAVCPEALLETDLTTEFTKGQYKNPRYAIKMATGTGKTWVLQALLVWQYLNARNGEAGRYARNFLIVAPGIIVYERLLDALAGRMRPDGTRDFEQSDIFRFRELFIPEQYRETTLAFVRGAVKGKGEITGASGDGVIAISNWHALAVETEEAEVGDVATPGANLDPEAILGGVLPVRPGRSAGNDLSVLDGAVARGREIEFLKGLPDLAVFNDEAHRVREDSKWQESLLEIASGHETYVQVDFSATPYEMVGEAKRYFPHIVVDFDLRTAIREGLVKILAIDGRQELASTALDYNAVRDDAGKVIDVSDGQRLMLRAGLAKMRLLEREFERLDPEKHPKMLVVCEETSVVPFVSAFLREEGLGQDDILEIHSNKKGEVGPEEWEVVRQKLFGIDRHRQPRVIVSVLMLREGFDVSNICVIVPLRSTQSNILLEQVVGRGLRLMWRGPEYDEARAENVRALLAKSAEPPSLIDILSVVEHPRFRDFYAQVIEGGYFVDDRGDDVVTGDVLGGFENIGLRPGYEAYDFAWPTIWAEPEETLADFRPDPSDVPPFTAFTLQKLRNLLPDQERFISTEATKGTRFGDYAVQSGVLMSESYGEYLQRLVQRIMTVLSEKLETRRSEKDVRYPLLAVKQRVIAEFVDRYVRERLFNEPFDPEETPSAWRPLLVAPVVEHLVNRLAATVLRYHQGKVEGSHDVRWRNVSEVAEIRGREGYLLEAAKTVYEKTPYPSSRGGLEKAFAEAAERDAKVEAFVKLIPTRHTFVSFRYQAENGHFGAYFPDFLVRIGQTVYIVETKGDSDVTSDLEVANKKVAAVSWCERINALPEATRRGFTFRYALVGESFFGEMLAKRLTVPQILEMATAYRAAVGRQSSLLA